MKSISIDKVCAALTCFILLQHGCTPLHCAASILHAELCKLLLGAKAEVEAKDKVRVALREGSKWVIYLKNQLYHGMMMMWAWRNTLYRIGLIIGAKHRDKRSGLWFSPCDGFQYFRCRPFFCVLALNRLSAWLHSSPTAELETAHASRQSAPAA